MPDLIESAAHPCTYHLDVPLYEYRCVECAEIFELSRAMADASSPATCPEGHPGAVRLISAFAAVNSPSRSTAAPAGPCGGSCACYPG